MNACTPSKLAREAGVSVHVVRDYVVRGLLRPATTRRAVMACMMAPP